MKGVKCIGPVFDLCGYAQWARTYILALIRSGVPVTIGSDKVRNTGLPITFEHNKPPLEEDGELLKQYVDKDIEYDTIICWLTPEMAVEQTSVEDPSIKKINMTLWETSRIPDMWIPLLNLMDEVWVPGEWNKQVIKSSFERYAEKHKSYKSILDKPIKTLNYPLNEDEYVKDVNPFEGLEEDTFVFYFISQWSERKNFFDLIEAYCHEFSKGENVNLVLKTYLRNSSSAEDRQTITNLLRSMISSTGLENPPPITLIHGNLGADEMKALQIRGDCYVSPSHGEGLGLGMVQAAMYENPVITHTFGEQSTYFKEDNSYIYNHYMRPVRGISNPVLYKVNQKWAAPDVLDMGKKMRYVFENQEEATKKAELCKKQIMEKCNITSVIEAFKKNLEE